MTPSDYFTELSKQFQEHESQGHSALKPSEYYGRVRISQGTYEGTGTAELGLCRVPRGARIVGAKAIGLNGATANLTLGYRGESDPATVDFTPATGLTSFAVDVPVSEDVNLSGLSEDKFIVGTLDAAGEFSVDVFYVVD